jgi:hypothetical protein
VQISGIAKIASVPTEWPTDQPTSVSVSKPSSSAQIQNPASVVQVTTLAATYSTTVSGKNYAGSVEEAAGVYIASVPSPPGITASGLNVQTAENNLDMKLDALA